MSDNPKNPPPPESGDPGQKPPQPAREDDFPLARYYRDMNERRRRGEL